MRLANLSNRLRRERVIFALDVALQDIAAPTPTIDIARMIARRLDTDEVALIGRIIVSLAPHLPQARQLATTFKRWGRDMHPWIWSPKAPSFLKETQEAMIATLREPTAVELLEAEYEAWCVAEGLERDEDHMWPEGALARFLALRKEKAQSDAPDGDPW